MHLCWTPQEVTVDVHYYEHADSNYNAVRVEQGQLGQALTKGVYAACGLNVRLVQPLTGKMVKDGRVAASPEPADVTCPRCLKFLDVYQEHQEAAQGPEQTTLL